MVPCSSSMADADVLVYKHHKPSPGIPGHPALRIRLRHMNGTRMCERFRRVLVRRSKASLRRVLDRLAVELMPRAMLRFSAEVLASLCAAYHDGLLPDRCIKAEPSRHHRRSVHATP